MNFSPQDQVQNSAPTSSMPNRELLRQQQIYMVQRLPMMSVVNFVNSSLVAVVFLQHAFSVWVLLCYTALCLSSGLQMLAWMGIRKKPIPKKVSGKSLARSEVWALMVGGAWGLFAVAAFPADSYPHQIFLAVIICGMTAGVAVILAPLPRVTSRFLVGALGPFVLRLFIAGEPIHLVLAVISSVFCFTMIRGSIWSFHQFSEMVGSSEMLRGTKEQLLSAIEATKDAFAIFDSDGTLVVANSRFNQWFPGGFEDVSRLSGTTIFQSPDGRWLQGELEKVDAGGLVCVYTDVTELKRREQDLVAAKTQAERSRQQADIERQHAQEADRAKTEFLANMSHELRTPLNAIIGFSEIMKAEMMGPLGSEQYKGYATDIFTSANHLLAIMSDILDLSRIETANYKITPEIINVPDTTEWVAALCRAQKDGSTRDIIVDCDPQLETLFVDQRAVRQVLINLTNNACKFTPDDKKVGIRTKYLADGRAELTVWDEGIGIPNDQLEKIREPFYQFESAFQKKYEGTGLGLSICDALAKLHGGQVDIQSELDAGTSVTVMLPADRVNKRDIEANEADASENAASAPDGEIALNTR